VTLPATVAVLPNQPGFDWDAVRAMPEVEALATIVVTIVVTVYSIDGVADMDSGACVPTVLTAGRLPVTAGEVALAVTSARLIGASIGSTVELTGGTGPRRLTVTGTGFVPSGSHNDYNEGAG
jgi:hypothetical protein